MPVFAFYDSQQTAITAIDLEVGQEAKPIVVELPPPNAGRVYDALVYGDEGVLVKEHTGLTSQNPKNPYRVFQVVAAKPGEWAVEVWEIGRKTGPAPARLVVRVSKVLPGGPELDYRGIYLAWRRTFPPGMGPEPLIFHSTSGIAGSQIASQMLVKDEGPLPEGTYVLRARLDPKRDSVAAANRLEARKPTDGALNLDEGVQFLPWEGDKPKYPSWGTLRVKLTPVSGNMGSRVGFYLHNSHKGYSSGCIEVGTTPMGVDFFTTLLRYATATTRRPEQLTLRVKYGHPLQDTRGDTLREGAEGVFARPGGGGAER